MAGERQVTARLHSSFGDRISALSRSRSSLGNYAEVLPIFLWSRGLIQPAPKRWRLLPRVPNAYIVWLPYSACSPRTPEVDSNHKNMLKKDRF